MNSKLIAIPALVAWMMTETVLPAAEAYDPHQANDTSAHQHGPPRMGEPINDLALRHFLEVEGAKLVKAGRAGGDFEAQLSRRTCVLPIRQPSPLILPPAEIAARAERAVVVVGQFYTCEKCTRLHASTATGFMLTESGAMATCLHVLKENKTLGLVALTRDGRICPMREVLAADPTNDLVIVQLDGSGFTPLPLSTSAPVGVPITVMSHPENHYYSLSTGIVSRYFLQPGRQGLRSMMAITADFAKGSSGAPVISTAGAVVGIVNNTQSIYYNTEKGQHDNFQMTVRNCTPTAALMKMIKAR